MKNRLDKPLKNWLKFLFWTLMYIAFIAWIGNFLWLLLIPFIFDIFITHFIPWDGWKKTKNRVWHTIFSWLDAIIFSLIAVYFINLYFFQNYKIPTSSLEKTLLVGDFLLVSKASYGPRIPNTPLSLPLVQHTLPLGIKSYLEKPQWKYRRLKGWDSVERGDIVVFNFPTGDTVPVKVNNPDYYTLIYNAGVQSLYYEGKISDEKWNIDSLKHEIYNKGKEIITSDEKDFGKIIWRPVDRRENYVKRCVAVAGDTLQIINNQIYINGKVEKDREGVQYNYFVQTDGATLTNDFFDRLNISADDRRIIPTSPYTASLGFSADRQVYFFPMSEEVKSRVEKLPYVKKIVVQPAPNSRLNPVFPLYANYNWDRDNYGPIYIPRKGATVEINPQNLPIYQHIIVNYENNRLRVEGDKIFVNDIEASSYTFAMDYYWMMGDNRHNSADSRYWGFVPEDHIVGRPVFVWLSLDKDKSLFKGKIRWKRFGKDASV